MNKRLLAVSMLVPFAGTILADSKPTNIRVINTGAVLEGSAAGKEKMEILEKDRQVILQILSAEQQKVVAKEKSIEEKGSTLSAAALKTAQAELELLKAELQKKYETANAEWQEKARKETAELKEMLDKCVQKVATTACAQGDCKQLVIVDQLTGSVLYSTPEAELTTAAIKEMDKAYTQKVATFKTPATKKPAPVTTAAATTVADKTQKTA